MSRRLRVAYTLEQCWHAVPGGTGVAALEVRDQLADHDELELVPVAGTHLERPAEPWDPGPGVRSLPGHGARLYASWLWLGRPAVERATGPVDVVHATTIIPPVTRHPLVVTIHDLAFLHEPAHFTRWGNAVFRRSLSIIRRRAALVLCSSAATLADCAAAGIDPDRLRLVPLGVRPVESVSAERVTAVRATWGLPERFVFAVGTLEPRKNLRRLADAVAQSGLGLPLVVAGPAGWGEVGVDDTGVRFLGFVDRSDLAALYAACTVFALPSLREGFGLPVLEAMQQGAPVVTSAGTSTEEVAGGAAVLVEPTSVDDIARGLHDAVERADELARLGRARAASATWAHTAELTLAAYREAARP